MGVYIVPCKVNNLSLKFIFDTGASDVTISLTEALFMLKNNYFNENDIIGTSYAKLANGEITENTGIILRKVEFAGLTLYNVKALVVHEMKAPLLLGQSAISQLGTIQINPATNTLTILNKGKNTFDYSQDKNIHSNIVSAICKDYDGNIYNTIIIGTQLWMKENLKTTHLNNGLVIPLVKDSIAWKNLKMPGYCWYYNDALKYKNIYGALYNWYSVNTNHLCPTGWHVPTYVEWTTLITYLESDKSLAGRELKEIGTSHWLSPNKDVNNISGFTALPSGGRNIDGMFWYIGNYGFWWSSTEDITSSAWSIFMSNLNSNVNSYSGDKSSGFSVRCLKD